MMSVQESKTSPDRTKSGIKTAFVAVSALLIAVLMAAWITKLQTISQEKLSSAVLISRLRTESVLIGRSEEAAVAEPTQAASFAADVRQSRTASQQLISALKAVAPESSVVSTVHAMTAYEDAVLTELNLYTLGRHAEAHKIDVEQVDPREKQVAAKVADTERILGYESETAIAQAQIGTQVCLISYALFLAALFFVFERSSRRATRLQAQRSGLMQMERKWNALVRNVSDVVGLLDERGRFTFVSSATTTMLGRDTVDLLDRPLVEFTLAEDALIAASAIDRSRAVTSQIIEELRFVHLDGTLRHCEVTWTDLTDDPDVGAVLVTLHDVSERKQYEQQLVHQAFHDVLTGLPNRALFNERLTSSLERSKRSGRPTGVLFLDIDNFKVVNDSLGHEQGDLLLVEISRRLQECTRPFDTVARLGGDEFTVLIEEVEDEAQLRQLSVRIFSHISDPISLGGRHIVPTASLGIAIGSQESNSEDLLRDADTAMYEAKTEGKARCCVFDVAMSSRAIERLELESDLRDALGLGQMRLVYQPIFSIGSGAVNGLEALLRWDHPTKGVVSPLRFISVAEESGLIIPLGDWVLRTACRTAKEWLDTDSGISESFTINVNISARQLHEDTFVEKTLQVLSSTGLSADKLKLEITESVMIGNMANSVAKLEQLRKLGVKIAIDDFGTGYCSMSYLSKLPVDTLKIDRSFINRLGTNEDGVAIVHAIIGMATALGLQVTSEGIETDDQLDQLKVLNCDHGQGFLYSKPIAAEAVTEFLMSHNGDADAGSQVLAA